MATASDKKGAAAPETLEETQARLAGKGRPTPSRREREAQRKRPLVPEDRRQANKEARAKLAQAREKARIGMANGEERYLPARDKGPQKRYVRDYVDARFSVGEVMIPLMFLVIVLTFFPQPEIQFFGILALWAFFLVAIIDCVVLGFLLNRRLKEKFGESRVERVRWYAAMRALQLRPMRLPKPQVKRGQYPA
ncbi:Protein of unknown function (DUF3043) [Diaminobutyricimonas aerilata]|uniref:DUF3043 family protein n=1 Tax=Diaminobutyricimonas aerilata TaxID=1162967 RepID=A0A2M9CKF4_9MICO|nr:DUF3043 domain-containing protein [Diaminobutyricimonas aerilata]PJJ72371.1 Protein of unknown function (DUF3043) [Diaminobutyricimonas aerilata]